MLALKILRVPITAAVISSPAKIPRLGRFDYYYYTRLQFEGFKSQVSCSLPRFSSQVFGSSRFSQYTRQLGTSGRKLATGSVVVGGVVGSVSFWSGNAYCDNDSYMLADHSETISWEVPDSEESIRRILRLMQKLLVPVFLLLTIWFNWGHSHPLFLAARITLILFCTKPIPSSVHIFVDQLQRQIMSRRPLLYRFKPLHAISVDVEDYVFLCLARVHIKDEKVVLLGILGSWWILPLSSSKEVFLFDKLSWKELVSLVKRRFRLAADTRYY